MTMERIEGSSYLPGIDWFRIIASTCVVAFHLGLANMLGSLAAEIFSWLVHRMTHCFFCISGYLVRKQLQESQESWKKLRRYLLRYYILYFVTVVVTDFICYYNLCGEKEGFPWIEYLCSVIDHPFFAWYTYQLWFVPPLLLGIAIWGSFSIHFKQPSRIIKVAVAVLLCMSVLFSSYPGILMNCFPVKLLENWGGYCHIPTFLQRTVEGVLYTGFGMWFAANQCKWKEYFARSCLMIAIACYLLEIQQYECFKYYECSDYLYTGFFGTVWLFFCLLRIKKPSLHRFRPVARRYGGLMFFLHVLEFEILKHWTKNNWLLFLLIILTNAGLALFISGIRKHIEKQKIQI